MRCPRPHCGGLILWRYVCTAEGTIEEGSCSACGRVPPGLVRYPAVYRPLTVRFRAEVEASLVERTDGASASRRVAPDSDDSMDIRWPRAARVDGDDGTA